MARRRLEVEIVGDSKNLERTLGRTETRLSRFDRKVSAIGGARGLGGLVGVGGFAGAIGGGIAISQLSKMVGVASNLNEQIAKTGQVFGKSAGDVREWSEGTARSLGIAQDKALEAAGTFGNLLRTMGLAPQESAEMSRSLVQLAADLASFNNASPEDTLAAINSALVGEVEPLRRYGANVSAAKVQTLAMAQSGKTNAKALTDQEKVLARVAIIMKETKIAQGDIGRTQGGLANQTRELNAQWRDLQANVGERFVPAATAGVTALNDLIGGLEGLAAVKIPPIHIPFMFDFPGGSVAGTLKDAFLGVEKNLPFNRAAIEAAGLLGRQFGGGTRTRTPELAAQFGQSLGGFFQSPLERGAGRVGVAGATPTPTNPFAGLPTIRAPLTGLSNRAQEKILNARLAGTDEALLKALRAGRGQLQATLGAGGLAPKDRLKVKQALLSIVDEIGSITAQQAAEAEQAAGDAKDAADAQKSKQQAARERKRQAMEDAARAADEFDKAIQGRAEDIKDAALQAIDRQRQKIDIRKELSDATAQLALARQIGSKTAIRDARSELETARLDQRRFLLENATLVGPKTRATASEGFSVTINGGLTLSGVHNARELAEALRKLSKGTASQPRGRTPAPHGI